MKRYKSDIPNLYIMGDINFDNGAKDRVELGKFDENGYLETDNSMLISRLAQLGYQPIAEVIQEPQVEPTSEPNIEPPIEPQTEAPQEDAKLLIEEKEVKIKIYTCKHCEFTTDNTGSLTAHYKKEHPKPKK